MDEEPLDSRGRNITLIVFAVIVIAIAALVINNYRTKAGWVAAMRSTDVAARKQAAEQMMRKGQVAEQLQGDRPSVRVAAVRSLAAVGTTAAAEQLIQFFKDADAPIKELAKQSVVALGPQVALVPAVKGLGDSDDSVRGNCDGTLRDWGEVSIEPVAPKLVDADARNTAATCLTEIGKQSPEKAKKVLNEVYPYLDPKTPGVDEVVQVRVTQILDGIGDPAPNTPESSVPRLIEMLQYPHTQRAAVGALGRKADKLATLPLLPILKNDLIRSETVIALGQIADPRAVPELIKLLGSFSEQVRTETAEALRKIGPASVPALLVAMKSPDAYTRATAVAALGGIKEPRAQAAALAALKDPNADVRLAAASSLKTWPSAAPIDPLVAAFNDRDGRVSDAAAETLAVIADKAPGGGAAIPKLVASLNTAANPARAYYAGRSLKLLGNAATVKALIAALQSPNPAIAGASARLLGDMGDLASQTALAPLKAAAASSTNEEVRWAAERAAARLGGEQTS
jgi:HEAT repeat protein